MNQNTPRPDANFRMDWDVMNRNLTSIYTYYKAVIIATDRLNVELKRLDTNMTLLRDRMDSMDTTLKCIADAVLNINDSAPVPVDDTDETHDMVVQMAHFQDFMTQHITSEVERCMDIIRSDLGAQVQRRNMQLATFVTNQFSKLRHDFNINGDDTDMVYTSLEM